MWTTAACWAVEGLIATDLGGSPSCKKFDTLDRVGEKPGEQSWEDRVLGSEQEIGGKIFFLTPRARYYFSKSKGGVPTPAGRTPLRPPGLAENLSLGTLSGFVPRCFIPDRVPFVPWGVPGYSVE